MSEIDDLADIISLLPDRSGSVNRTPSNINAGQRLWRRIHARPKWRKQLAMMRGWRSRRKRESS